MLATVNQLWRGDMPLSSAFWIYAVTYGVIANLISAALALILYMQFENVPLTILAHVLPWPYLILAFVGTWRSAERYRGPEFYAALIKVALILLAAGSVLL